MFADAALIAAGSGLLAGALHALLGPDHLAAILPLSVGRPGTRAWIGVRWGAGHAVGTWALALAVALAGQALPMDILPGVAERLVGIALIGVGLWGLRVAYRSHLHIHSHTHDSRSPHQHFHLHGAEPHTPRAHVGHRHAAMGVGFLHGIAGAGPFIALLPAVFLPDRGQGLAYVLAYGLGAMLAMGVFTYLVAQFAERLGYRSDTGYRRALVAASGGAICVGTVWLVL